MFDYDSWLTSGYDNERVISVRFDCVECEAENEQGDIVVGSRSGDADIECIECGKINAVSFGDDE